MGFGIDDVTLYWWSGCVPFPLFLLLADLASGDANALVRGQTGRGREVAGRWHRSARQTEGPFSPRTCFVLDGTLVFIFLKQM